MTTPLYVDALAGSITQEMPTSGGTSTVMLSAGLNGTGNNPGCPTIAAPFVLTLSLFTRDPTTYAVTAREDVTITAFTSGDGTTSGATVLRGQNGTTIQDWPVGSLWSHGWNVAAINNARQSLQQFNIMDFGAQGDFDGNTGVGGTHDNAALTAAVAAAQAAGGGMIVVPKSPYGNGFGYKFNAGVFATNTTDIGLMGIGWPVIYWQDSGGTGVCVSQKITDPAFWTGQYDTVTCSSGAASQNTITVSSVQGLANGTFVYDVNAAEGLISSGNPIPGGTTISSIAGNVITLSTNVINGGCTGHKIGFWNFPSGQAQKQMSYQPPPPIMGCVFDGLYCGTGTVAFDWGPLMNGYFDCKIRNFTGNNAYGIRWRNSIYWQFTATGSMSGTSALTLTSDPGVFAGFQVVDLTNPGNLPPITTVSSGSGTSWTLSNSGTFSGDTLAFGFPVWSEENVLGPNVMITNTTNKCVCDAYNGTSSFGYTTIQHMFLNSSDPGERGFVIQSSVNPSGGAIMYSSSINIKGNNTEASNGVISYAGSVYGSLSTALTAGTSGVTSIVLSRSATVTNGQWLSLLSLPYTPYSAADDFDASTDSNNYMQYVQVNGNQTGSTITVNSFTPNYSYPSTGVGTTVQGAATATGGFNPASFMGLLSSTIASGATGVTLVPVSNAEGQNIYDGQILTLRNGGHQQQVVVDGNQTSTTINSNGGIVVRPFTALYRFGSTVSGTDYVASVELSACAVVIGGHGDDKSRLQGVVDIAVEGWGPGLVVGTAAIVETTGHWNFGEWSWNYSTIYGLLRHAGLVNIPGYRVGIQGEIQSGNNTWSSALQAAGESEINGALLVRPPVPGGVQTPPADAPGALISANSSNDATYGSNTGVGSGGAVLGYSGDNVAFYGGTPIAKQSSTGVTTVAGLITLLKNLGLLS